MRKFYLLFAALFAGSVVASAGVKNLYKQDFESVTNVADAGWVSPSYPAGMSLQSTEFGQWFRFDLGTQNNRNAVMNFNTGVEGTIFDGQDVKEYTVKFQWGLVKNPQVNGQAKNTQFSSEVALLNDKWEYVSNKSNGYNQNNGQYASLDSICLFSITQLKGAWQAEDLTKEPPVQQTPYWTDENDASSYAFDFYINGDKENVITLQEGMWYDIVVKVNVESRTAAYTIHTLDGDLVKEGEYTLAENASPYVKGLNVLLGRYMSVADIDEVKVQVPTEGDYANKPSVSLTEIDMAKRSYDIYFEEGEILHIKKTDGTEDTAVESPYEYETETSGTLEAWTESGSALSEKVTMEVVAEAISLPAAQIDIMKVNSGYEKELRMTVDNSAVPTQPNITLTWEYSNGDASTDEVASGAVYEAKDKGTLTVTTHAYGFQETTTTFENNTEFAIDATVDFQHMEEADLTAKGFVEIDPLQSSEMKGENNWTARKRLWFGIKNGEVAEDGSEKYDTYYVWAPEGNEGAEAIRRFVLAPSKLTAETYNTLFAPLYTWYTGQADPAVADGSDVAALKINYGIGLINTGVKGDAQDAGITIERANVGIDGLTDNDYYIVYCVNDYGSNSEHPIFDAGTSYADAKAQYLAMNIGTPIHRETGKPTVYKGTELFSYYRIDTAITRIDVFKSTGESGIQEVGKAVVSDHNAPVYNLNGERVSTLKKGVYVKQGKKFIVR